MKTDRVVFSSLGGGIRQDDSPIAIENGQCSSIENFDVREKHLARRDGISRVYTQPRSIGDPKTLAKPACGVKFFDTGVLLIACSDRFAVGAGIGTSDLVGPTITEDPYDPWIMVDNNGVIWAARRSCETLLRITEARADEAGVTPPATAPAAASGAAGVITAGRYGYRYKYVTDKGDESPASDEVEITLASDLQVNLTGLVASSQARVVSKNIYRTLKDDAGAWWLVDTIPNATTSYTDNIENSQLGDQMDPEIFVPPEGIRGLTKWMGRLWVHDGVQVYASKIGAFETFYETFDSFDARGDREVTALHPWDTRLMVATDEQIFQLTETGVDAQGIRYNVSPFSTDTGCVAPASMKSAIGRLFWCARDGVYMSDGGAPRRISEPIQKSFIEWSDSAYLRYSSAYIDQENGEYCLTVGVGSASVQFVYNWKNSTWTTRRFKDDSAGGSVPSNGGPMAQTEKDGVVYLAFCQGYNVYRIERDAPASWIDRGISEHMIAASARMKAIREPGSRTAVRKVYLHVSGRTDSGGNALAPAEDLTVRLYQDGDQAACRQATIRLDDEPNRTLKRIGLGAKESNWRPLCSSFEVEVDYEGREPIDLNEAQFERDLFGIDGRAL